MMDREQRKALNTAFSNVTKASSALYKALHAKSQDPAAVEQAKQNLENAKAVYAEAKNPPKEQNKAEQRDKEHNTAKQEQDKSEMNVSKDVNEQAEQRDKEHSTAKTEQEKADANKMDPADFFEGLGNAALGGLNDSAQNMRNFDFSDTFYRDVAAGIRGRPTGNRMDIQAAGARAQAQNDRNMSADRQMEAQRAEQVASRNPYSEAGKVASVQNDAENRQIINNQSFAAGTSSARLRKTNTPDVQTQMARQDEQRNVANTQRESAGLYNSKNLEKEMLASQKEIESRDFDTRSDEARRLSLGQPGSDEETQKTEETQQTEETQKTEDPENSLPTGDPQHVINAILGSPLGEDLRKGTATKDQELYKWALDQGLTPWTNGQQGSDDANAWEGLYFKQYPNAKAVFHELRTARANGKDPSTNFVRNKEGVLEGAGTSMAVPTKTTESDYRVKDIHSLKAAISDMRMKHIREDYEDGLPCSDINFKWLLERAGKYKDGDTEYDLNSPDFDMSNESVVNGYANHIKNYIYNYKPEAQNVDPSIDPDEEHIGPMAQDIEKVNPACIKETEDGIKTVDTSRLALMNAGAIGDIARQLSELTEKLKALGV